MGTGLNAMTPARISISSISYGFHNAVNNVHTYGLICVYRAVCDSACDTQRIVHSIILEPESTQVSRLHCSSPTQDLGVWMGSALS